MKITALLVLKCNQDGFDPIVLANASGVSHFGYFQRPTLRNSLSSSAVSSPRERPPARGNSSTTKHLACFSGGFWLVSEYKVHTSNRKGLCVLGFMDDHYPIRSAFSLLKQLLHEYQKNFGDSWRSVMVYGAKPWGF
ncbi:hypothetical protein MLD38_028768 [Melastoma candidum]|uniref:Uncharacterized protein n=1 Tax=Melastoma candidum TaxID=119954 RepID=A0ACB9N3S6_9MYRT|nr:hypothetical protein MLD38_028768 [Melastoma candidum]